jgi:hypothetical protein
VYNELEGTWKKMIAAKFDVLSWNLSGRTEEKK